MCHEPFASHSKVELKATRMAKVANIFFIFTFLLTFYTKPQKLVLYTTKFQPEMIALDELLCLLRVPKLQTRTENISQKELRSGIQRTRFGFFWW